MQIFVNSNFDFMGKRKLALAISGIATLIAVGSLIAHGGPRYSVDFTGGTFVEARFDRPVDPSQLREARESIGLSASEIQKVGEDNDYIFRLKAEEVAAKSQQYLGSAIADPFGLIQHAMKQKMPDVGVTLRRQETVGPKVGGELRNRATQAVLVSLLLMLVYIAFRFPGVSFAVCAVIALFHDVILTLGVFSVMNKEVSLTVLAALLTIAGYSINDTIVVYDRIREELKARRKEPLIQVVNRAVNLTLSRTMLTGLTTIFALFALYFVGGSVIHDFAFAMLIGILWGTYSSVFVASALVVTWELARQKRETARPSAKGPRPAPIKAARTPGVPAER
jgi:preprotein translocase subunit SecF